MKKTLQTLLVTAGALMLSTSVLAHGDHEAITIGHGVGHVVTYGIGIGGVIAVLLLSFGKKMIKSRKIGERS